MASVKNINAIGPSGNIKPILVQHPIPPIGNAIMKVVIEADSGNIDLEDLVLNGSYSDGVTNTIGSFTFKIIDPDKSIYNRVSTFDEILIYAGYSTADLPVFRGIIENRGYIDSYLTISGRSVGMIFSEKNIIYNSSGAKSISTILTEIITANFPDINTSNIETNSTTTTVNYYEIPMSQIINELCSDTYEFYLNQAREAHYFTKGSRTNSTEAIIEDVNLIETTSNEDNTEETYSKVRVYGFSEDGIGVLATSTSSTTQTGGIIKEFKIDNSSVTTTNQAQDLADREYAKKSSIPRIGSISCLFLPTLLPGEKLFIASPREEINPNHYTLNSYTHEFDLESNTWAKTTIEITKRKVTTSSLLKERINFESEITENLNPYDLDTSEIITFESDIGTHSNTQISDGYLKVVPGGSTGTWISPIYSLNSDLAGIELRWSGDLLIQDYETTTSQLWFSSNGGAPWKPGIINGQSVSGTIPPGRNLRIKVVLNTSDARVKRIGIYYKY